MSARDYWNELNKLYGTDLEMSEEVEANSEFDMEAVAFDMAMGKSFDSATQQDM